MDRLRAKISQNSDQLREECEALQMLLNNILCKDKDITANATTLNSAKSYLLQIMQYQSAIIEKLLDTGVDLDIIYKKSPETSHEDALLCTDLVTKISSDLPGNQNKAPPQERGFERDETLVSGAGIKPTIDKNAEIGQLLEVKTSTEEEEVETQECCNEEQEQVEIEGNDNLANRTESDDTSSGNSAPTIYCSESISSADISSSEEMNVNLQPTQDKLKLKRLLSRRDRNSHNIQRPDMPDLSFKSLCERNQSDHKISSALYNSVLPATNEKSSKFMENSKFGYKEPADPYINLQCVISKIVSPSQFYINHLDDYTDLVDAISYQLAEIFKGTKSPFKDKESAMNELGTECACYLEKYDCWYRVQVTNWRLQAKDYLEKYVTVYLVDYGHTYNLSYENLRKLSNEFCHIPKGAIKCHLAWLYPPESTKDNLLHAWPKSSYDYFYSLFSNSEGSIYNVVYVEKCGDSWGIDLIVADSHGSEVLIGQQMLNNKTAVEIFQNDISLFRNNFVTNQIKTAQSMIGASSIHLDGNIEKYEENLDKCEYNNIDQAMIGYRAMDETRICKHTRSDGTCFKGNRCKLEHGKLRPDGYTTDKDCVYVSAFKQLDMPEAGMKIKLQITNVISVNSFYGCLINSNTKSLNALTHAMNKQETISKYKSLQILPAQGEIVIAKNWNGHWYRARVCIVYHFHENPEETIQLFFVDLGEIVDVKMSEIRIIRPEFLELPFQAILFRLYNVKQRENIDPLTAKNYVENHFLCQIFDAEVKHTSHSVLEILLKRKDNGEDVGEQIIDDGFGELNTNHHFPAGSLLVD